MEENQGSLPTSITRKALEIDLDYPMPAEIRVQRGEVSGPAKVDTGHLLGKLPASLW